MSSVNKVILIGNLGIDPEFVELSQDRVACRLSVATHETWKDRISGERKQKTQWHRVIVFDQVAVRFARDHLAKGNLVFIEGRVKHRTWEDASGEKRSTTEVLLSGPGSRLMRLSQPVKKFPADISVSNSRPDDIWWSSKGLVSSDVPF
ncbi:single-stranded DNA-binding protein [Ruegeria arenilitoris]|uniref:single-stranded DNA-binding protein n=1 Tax=Ruegeria arenilitoris TaxID=1173585 RepID=UPI0014810B2D|nr:single-stranded DNA-binding protein [Ruegeria arenilitoris]